MNSVAMWDEQAARTARRQGWMLCVDTQGATRIERLDQPAFFADDDAAEAWVMRRALLVGCDVALLALKVLKRTNQKAWRAITEDPCYRQTVETLDTSMFDPPDAARELHREFADRWVRVRVTCTYIVPADEAEHFMQCRRVDHNDNLADNDNVRGGIDIADYELSPEEAETTLNRYS